MSQQVCVFASSSPRTPQVYLDAAADLGRRLAQAKLAVVNGAGRDGGMGALNDAIVAAGGAVRGVILRQFLDDGLEHPGLDELLVAEVMRERKRLLGEQADAFVVLPGGPGTWEEFWEVAVERQIAVHTKPLVVINTDGFYNGFLQQAKRAATDGLLYGPIEALFEVVATPAEAVSALASQDGSHLNRARRV